jgi:spore coat-associated protein N
VKRAGIMLSRHRYLTLAAVALLVAAGAVAAFSGAAFSYKTANPSNTFTAGTLTHTNDRNNAAILTAGPMKPGDHPSGQVTITNTGNLQGKFFLSMSGLSDLRDGTYGGKLSNVLRLKVVDLANPGTPLYDDLLKNFPKSATSDIPIDLGTFAASGGAHTYEFTVTFTDGGVPAANDSGDNVYQNAQLTVQFDWNETQT